LGGLIRFGLNETEAAGGGRQFDAEIIVLCVRWYLRYPLSLRQLEEIMAERNLSVNHVTFWLWVHRYAPELNQRCRPELSRTRRKKARKNCNQRARAPIV
jgi:transposase-like protein